MVESRPDGRDHAVRVCCQCAGHDARQQRLKEQMPIPSKPWLLMPHLRVMLTAGDL